ncbi:MAG: hypothetical protein Fur0039_16210 [Rhodocyclaceae bacterium]
MARREVPRPGLALTEVNDGGLPGPHSGRGSGCAATTMQSSGTAQGRGAALRNRVVSVRVRGCACGAPLFLCATGSGGPKCGRSPQFLIQIKPCSLNNSHI